jgi:hypothetical protein
MSAAEQAANAVPRLPRALIPRVMHLEVRLLPTRVAVTVALLDHGVATAIGEVDAGFDLGDGVGYIRSFAFRLFADWGSEDDTTSGGSRESFTALGYGANHGMMSDAMSVAERYHSEDGPCRNLDHQSLTWGALGQVSNV